MATGSACFREPKTEPGNRLVPLETFNREVGVHGWEALALREGDRESTEWRQSVWMWRNTRLRFETGSVNSESDSSQPSPG